MARTNVFNPDGQYVSREESELPELLRLGYRLPSSDEQVSQEHERDLRERYGDAPVQAGLYGAARGATFGLSDLMVDKEKARALKKFNPSASAVGEVGGSVLSTALLPEAGALGAVGNAALQGALVGAGQGVSESALGPDPDRTAEDVALAIGKRALFGAALGGAAGGAVAVTRKGIAGLGELVEGQAAARAAGADVSAEAMRKALSLRERGRGFGELLQRPEGELAQDVARTVESHKSSLADLPPEAGERAAGLYDRWNGLIADHIETLSNSAVTPRAARRLGEDVATLQAETGALRAEHGLVPDPGLDPDLIQALEVRAGRRLAPPVGPGLLSSAAGKAGEAAAESAGYALGHLPGYIVARGTGLPGLAGRAASSAAEAASDPFRWVSALDRLSGDAARRLSQAAEGLAAGTKFVADAAPAALASAGGGAFDERVRTVDAIADDPTGSLQRMRSAMGPLADHAPGTSDALAGVGLRAAQFLSQNAPRPPGGSDPFRRWAAPPGAAARFNRLYETLLDPSGMLPRLATGDVLPEELDAVQAVYPKTWARLRERVMERVAAAPDGVPPAGRWVVSRLLGGTVDAVSPSAGALVRSLSSQAPPPQAQAPEAPAGDALAPRFRAPSERLAGR